MAAPLAGFASDIVAYAEKRLPALTPMRKPEALPIRLHRRRIYVLPTRFGLVFGVLLFVMLIGALNYSNNPALLLTCLFGAAGGASLFAGFRAMNGLELASIAAGECHVGSPLPLHLRFAGGARARPSLRVRREGTETAFAMARDRDADVALAIPTERRGWLRPGRVRVWTDYPLGLFQIWSWAHPDLEFLVFPAPESPPPPLPGGTGREDQRTIAGRGDEPSGLRDYRATDPPRLIAWKASARHDKLLVRDAEQRSGDSLVLDYRALPELDHEARIRRLAAWVLAAEAAQRAYALALPSETIGPALGPAHRYACLRALALLPDHG